VQPRHWREAPAPDAAARRRTASLPHGVLLRVHPPLYKLFRLPFQKSTTDGNYLDVYTFGGRGWRRHTDIFQRHNVRSAGSPPVLIDGKIYMLTKQNEHGCTPDNILVIYVASETYRTYRPMPDHGHSVTAMDLFELGEQPCISVIFEHGKLHLWTMSTPELVQGGEQQLEKKFCGDWEPRYSFYHNDLPICYYRAMVDDGFFCCLIDNRLYTYDTTSDENKHRGEEDIGDRYFGWDHKLRLPSSPADFHRVWRIYGGYHPTLLSPRDLYTTKGDHH
jgi:hypothetical protein